MLEHTCVSRHESFWNSAATLIAQQAPQAFQATRASAPRPAASISTQAINLWSWIDVRTLCAPPARDGAGGRRFIGTKSGLGLAVDC